MEQEKSCTCVCGCHEEKHEHKESHLHEHGHDHEHDHCGCGCGCGHDHGGNGTVEKQTIFRLSGALVLFFVGSLLPDISVLKNVLLIAAYLISGWDVFRQAVENIRKLRGMDETFLMTVASLGACLIGEIGEGAAVMLFYNIGEQFQSYAVYRSRTSIRALMDIRPDTAFVLEHGQPVERPAESVNVGEVILVRAGERIPLDGRIVNGASQVDTSALTGEALPRDVVNGDVVLAGCINLSGVLQIQVNKPFQESTASKMLVLAERAGANKAKTEKFITKFARYYTPAVVWSAVAIAIFPPLLGVGTWEEYIYRALTFLVISCPCALVISVPMGFFAGIGCASSNGVLIKGGNYLDALRDVKAAVFDKTGTLTYGTLEVMEVRAVSGNRDELLELAALSEVYSKHPIASSLLRAYGKEPDRRRVTDVKEIAGKGVEACIDGEIILAGNKGLMELHGVFVPERQETGTCIYIGKKGMYLGEIIVGDRIKPEAKQTLTDLKKLGIETTVMLTGDHIFAAEQIGREVGIDIVRAGLLPEDKVTEIEKLTDGKYCKGKVLFVGDGINDAPVLARADVGIAMGGMGTDAAMEAADVVIMDDRIDRLITAIRIARGTHRIVVQNIVFSLCVKLIVLTIGAMGYASVWAAVFADVGVSFLAVLNSLRALRADK